MPWKISRCLGTTDNRVTGIHNSGYESIQLVHTRLSLSNASKHTYRYRNVGVRELIQLLAALPQHLSHLHDSCALRDVKLSSPPTALETRVASVPLTTAFDVWSNILMAETGTEWWLRSVRQLRGHTTNVRNLTQVAHESTCYVGNLVGPLAIHTPEDVDQRAKVAEISNQTVRGSAFNAPEQAWRRESI